MTLNQQTSDTVINIGGVNATNVNKPVVIDGVSYWQILPGVSSHEFLNKNTLLRIFYLLCHKY
jgi:hypothetical protein